MDIQKIKRIAMVGYVAVWAGGTYRSIRFDDFRLKSIGINAAIYAFWPWWLPGYLISKTK